MAEISAKQSGVEVAVNSVQGYVLPVLIVAGLASNVLMCVGSGGVIKRQVGYHDIYIFLFIISLLNICTLLSHQQTIIFLSTALGRNYIEDVRQESRVACTCFEFIQQFVDQTSRWLMAAMTSLLCVQPRQNRGIRQSRYAVDATATVVALSAMFNAHYFWTYDLDWDTPTSTSCRMILRSFSGMRLPHENVLRLKAIIWAVRSPLPLCSILALLAACLIIRRYRHHRHLHQLQQQASVAASADDCNSCMLNTAIKDHRSDNQIQICVTEDNSNEELCSNYENNVNYLKVRPLALARKDDITMTRLVTRLAVAYVISHVVSVGGEVCAAFAARFSVMATVSVFVNQCASLSYYCLFFPITCHTDPAFRCNIVDGVLAADSYL